MAAEALCRNAVLAVPVLVAVLILGMTRPSGKQVATSALAGCYVFALILLAHLWPMGWEYTTTQQVLVGVPVEAAVGWAVLWGCVPTLLGGPTWLWVVGLLWGDVLTMPLCEAMVTLQPNWVVYDAALLTVAVVPATIFARCTRDGTALRYRVAFQMVTVTAWFMCLVPLAAHSADQRLASQWAIESSWDSLMRAPMWLRGSAFMVGGLLLTTAVAAVAELADVGGGTPYPWDPPSRLVTSGPYAYLANPMQFGVIGVYLMVAMVAHSVGMAIAVVVAVSFSVAMANVCEQQVLTRRWPDYAAYCAQVRMWWPRWRPCPDPQISPPATAWFSATCRDCSRLADLLWLLKPVGVHRACADDRPNLHRMTWTASGLGEPASGTQAVARILERGNLATAWLSWFIRLPVLAQVTQVVTDAVGFGPRPSRPVELP